MYDRANVQHSGLGLKFEIPGIVQKKIYISKCKIFFTFYSNELKAQKKREKKKKEIPGKTK